MYKLNNNFIIFYNLNNKFKKLEFLNFTYYFIFYFREFILQY